MNDDDNAFLQECMDWVRTLTPSGCWCYRQTPKFIFFIHEFQASNPACCWGVFDTPLQQQQHDAVYKFFRFSFLFRSHIKINSRTTFIHAPQFATTIHSHDALRKNFSNHDSHSHDANSSFPRHYEKIPFTFHTTLQHVSSRCTTTFWFFSKPTSTSKPFHLQA